MIQRMQDRKVSLRENMRGGQGTVTIREIFSPDTYRGKSRLIATITVPPGGSIGMHEHENEEEIYHVLAGEAVLESSTESEPIVLRPGDASLTLGGESHAIRNDGQEDLQFLAIILVY